MKLNYNPLLAAALAARAVWSKAAIRQEPPAAADILFVNGTIYSIDGAFTVFNPGALAVTNGTITCIGPDAQCRPTANDATQVVDVNGKAIIPGLIDAHIHPIDAGRAMLGCTLRYQHLNLTALQTIIQQCLDREPNAGPDSVLTVTEWDRETFTDINGPANATMLDSLKTTRPVMLIATNQHNVWVNTRGLQILNISRSSADPPGGRIGRDANGFPTGVLEENAAGPARALSGDRGISTVDAATAGLSQLRKRGITTFMDALATPHDAWSTLKQQGQLTARVFSCFGIFGSNDMPTIAEQARNASATLDEGPLIANAPGQRWKHVKFFVDGVLPQVSQSALLLQPYLVDNGDGTFVNGTNFGIPGSNVTQLVDLFTRILDIGMGVHVHGVGDAAVQQILDAAQGFNRQFNNFELGIAHAELVAASDLARLGSLGIPAIMSYQWAQKASYWNLPTQKSLGPDRMANAEPHAALAAAGSLIAYGSDWPVDPLDPFLALKIGVTREGDVSNRNSYASFGPQFVGRLDNQPGLSRQSALQGMTSNAAAYLNSSASIGSLEVGKFADLIILDRDFFDETAVPDEQLGQNKVLLTMVGGRAVFADAETLFLPQTWVEDSAKLDANPVVQRLQPGNILSRDITGQSCGSHAKHGHKH